MMDTSEVDLIALEEDFGADIVESINSCEDEASLQLLIELASERLLRLTGEIED